MSKGPTFRVRPSRLSSPRSEEIAARVRAERRIAGRIGYDFRALEKYFSITNQTSSDVTTLFNLVDVLRRASSGLILTLRSDGDPIVEVYKVLASEIEIPNNRIILDARELGDTFFVTDYLYKRLEAVANHAGITIAVRIAQEPFVEEIEPIELGERVSERSRMVAMGRDDDVPAVFHLKLSDALESEIPRMPNLEDIIARVEEDLQRLTPLNEANISERLRYLRAVAHYFDAEMDTRLSPEDQIRLMHFIAGIALQYTDNVTPREITIQRVDVYNHTRNFLTVAVRHERELAQAGKLTSELSEMVADIMFLFGARGNYYYSLRSAEESEKESALQDSLGILLEVELRYNRLGLYEKEREVRALIEEIKRIRNIPNNEVLWLLGGLDKMVQRAVEGAVLFFKERPDFGDYMETDVRRAGFEGVYRDLSLFAVYAALRNAREYEGRGEYARFVEYYEKFAAEKRKMAERLGLYIPEELLAAGWTGVETHQTSEAMGEVVGRIIGALPAVVSTDPDFDPATYTTMNAEFAEIARGEIRFPRLEVLLRLLAGDRGIENVRVVQNGPAANAAFAIFVATLGANLVVNEPDHLHFRSFERAVRRFAGEEILQRMEIHGALEEIDRPRPSRIVIWSHPRGVILSPALRAQGYNFAKYLGMHVEPGGFLVIETDHAGSSATGDLLPNEFLDLDFDSTEWERIAMIELRNRTSGIRADFVIPTAIDQIANVLQIYRKVR